MSGTTSGVLAVIMMLGLMAVGCSSDVDTASELTAASESAATVPESPTPTSVESLTFSMRPVYSIVQTSPALTDPDGDHPDNLDPVTGLSDPDDVTAEIAYLPADDGFGVYVVGPAFLTGADMEGGRAQFSGTGGVGSAGAWVVVPEFTDEGGEKFRAATGELATYPIGSPQRQLAIVVDGVVSSAPVVASEVDPNEGLDPNQVVITIGSSDSPQADAEDLAAALQR